MKTVRDIFGEELLELMKNDPTIILLSTDMLTPTRTMQIEKEFPNRVIKLGICEANAIGIATGLCDQGFKVVYPCFASFLTGRYDQIRCSLDYPKSRVVLVGTHPGVAIGKDGATQMGIEDINVLRALPNMTILQPSTREQVVTNLKDALYLNSGPTYLRIARQEADAVISSNRNNYNSKVAIFYSGPLLSIAKDTANLINIRHGIDCRIMNVNSIKPLDIGSISQQCKIAITIEDHSIIGGLGSAVSEVIAELGLGVRVCKFGINGWPFSADPKDLYEYFNLTAKKIFQATETSISNIRTD